LIGEDWPVYDDEIKALFIFNNQIHETTAVYKHPTRLGVIIPELEFVPPGI
jgi:hypothetical protein